MKITLDQPQGSSAVDTVSPAATPVKSERTSTLSSTAATVEKASTTAAAPVVHPAKRQTDVTFRRDNNGRVYYVVSDANSGQEIIEVPTQAVRDVSQGIEDYLKQEQSKSGPHLETKA